MTKTRFALAVALGALLVGGTFVGVGLAGQGPMHRMAEERFKAMDKDGDGKVSTAEFEAYHAAKHKAADLNADGKVTFEEMMEARERQREERKKAFFKSLDTDGDGALSEAEIKAFHDEKFAALDANKDGAIGTDEFRAGCDQWRGRHGGYGSRMD